MQLTTVQVLDIAIDCLLFGFPLLVLLDFIRVLPDMARASLQPVEVQTILPDPWDLPLQESSLAKGNEVVTDTTKITKPKKSRRQRTNAVVQMELIPDEMAPKAIPKASAQKLSFKRVDTDFANKGYTFEKHSKGRTRYRVNLDNRQYHFKNLQEAIDWLGEQPKLVNFPTHCKLEISEAVIV